MDVNLGASALHEAAYAGHKSAIETLVNSGSNLVLRDAAGNSVRFVAVLVNAPRSDCVAMRFQALHYAAEQGHIDCLHTLLVTLMCFFLYAF